MRGRQVLLVAFVVPFILGVSSGSSFAGAEQTPVAAAIVGYSSYELLTYDERGTPPGNFTVQIRSQAGAIWEGHPDVQGSEDQTVRARVVGAGSDGSSVFDGTAVGHGWGAGARRPRAK